MNFVTKIPRQVIRECTYRVHDLSGVEVVEGIGHGGFLETGRVVPDLGQVKTVRHGLRFGRVNRPAVAIRRALN